MNTLLDIYNILRLNHEITENMNRVIISNETEAIIKSFPGPDGFTAEFYQTFKEGLIPIILKLFSKIEEEEILPNSFYKASITLIPKPDKATSRNNSISSSKLIDPTSVVSSVDLKHVAVFDTSIIVNRCKCTPEFMSLYLVRSSLSRCLLFTLGFYIIKTMHHAF